MQGCRREQWHAANSCCDFNWASWFVALLVSVLRYFSACNTPGVRLKIPFCLRQPPRTCSLSLKLTMAAADVPSSKRLKLDSAQDEHPGKEVELQQLAGAEQQQEEVSSGGEEEAPLTETLRVG